MENFDILGASNENCKWNRREKLQLTARRKKPLKSGINRPFADPGLSIAGKWNVKGEGGGFFS